MGPSGYSSGGYCTANLALRHPSSHGAAAIINGYYRAAGGPAGAALGNNQSLEDANSPAVRGGEAHVGQQPSRPSGSRRHARHTAVYTGGLAVLQEPGRRRRLPAHIRLQRAPGRGRHRRRAAGDQPQAARAGRGDRLPGQVQPADLVRELAQVPQPGPAAIRLGRLHQPNQRRAVPWQPLGHLGHGHGDRRHRGRRPGRSLDKRVVLTGVRAGGDHALPEGGGSRVCWPLPGPCASRRSAHPGSRRPWSASTGPRPAGRTQR